MKLLNPSNRVEPEERLTLATDDVLFPGNFNFELELRMIRSESCIKLRGYLNELMVGEVSLSIEEDSGRFQAIWIESEFRERGIRETLIYETGKIALEHFGATQLLIDSCVASGDLDSYQSIGFRPKDNTRELALLS